MRSHFTLARFVGVVGFVGICSIGLTAGPVRAENGDRALLDLRRPAANTAAVRGAPVQAIEWERRLRPPDRFGPPPLRAADAALVAAARAGQDDLVRQLLQRGAEIDRIDDDGSTALGAAAAAGRRSTVRLLLRAGADATRRGASGQTALHLASLAGQVDVLKEMLRLKVDPELLNAQRESAIDLAAAAGQQDAMALLIDAGADLARAGRR